MRVCACVPAGIFFRQWAVGVCTLHGNASRTHAHTRKSRATAAPAHAMEYFTLLPEHSLPFALFLGICMYAAHFIWFLFRVD